MGRLEEYMMFEKLQKFLETKETKEIIKKTVESYILSKNWVNIKDINLGDKNEFNIKINVYFD